MNNDFSPAVGKIVEDYLRRLRGHLQGLPEKDQNELTREVYSHIFESFGQEDGSRDEIDRILAVLARLGEPETVVAESVGASMVGMGKRRKLPLYILGGLLIGLFGLPLGAGGAVVFLGMVLGLLTLVLIYYTTAAALTIGGALGVLVTFMKWISPDFAVHLGVQWGLAPDFESLPARLLLSFLMTGLGLALFWGGRYLMKGLKFIIGLVPRTIGSALNRRRMKKAGLTA